MSEDARSAERVARNNSVFRSANERIQGAAVALMPNELIPFLCECPDPECTDVVRMSLDEYEAVRAEPTHFIAKAGDEQHAWATVVERRDGYEIVAKTGRASEVARELDPRSQ